jgi:2-dehydro-3-deoxyphosphogluconate aldolase / (4S)-4-hydroxy-2-oxoglutarate aldolase
MKLSKEEILSKMYATGLIPVFYHDAETTARKIVDTCYEGGIRVFEFTNRGKNALTVFAALVQHIKKYNDAVLGIGTIMNSKDVFRFAEIGADFIVSPVTKVEMAEACRKVDKLWIPGSATLTEIVTAVDAGAHLVKVFPASVLGPAFISSIRPVVPEVRLMPTGGVEVTEANLDSWFKAGVHCVGVGSPLLRKQYIDSQNWEALLADVTATVEYIKNTYRSK